MVTFKVVIADPTTGKCDQKEVEGEGAKALLGKKIGDSLSGDVFDLKGKSLVVTGGSDYCGFPMRHDLPGTQRKRILITKSVGFRGGFKGERRRRTVAGNTIHLKIHQVNLKVVVDKQKKASVKKEAKTDKVQAKKVVVKKVVKQAKKESPKKEAKSPAKKVAAKKDAKAVKKETAKKK